MEEIWKDIKGYEGFYQVSNQGRVKSLDRKVFNRGNNTWCNLKGKFLIPSSDNGKYPYVILSKTGTTKKMTFKIHRLVAFAFCNGYAEGLEVNHINGVRDDNRSENLEWVTRSGNIRDIYKRGLNTNGEKNNSSKLKDEYIGIITSLYDSGVSQMIIADAFGVSQGTISNVVTNKHYKNGLIDLGLALPIDGKEVEG